MRKILLSITVLVISATAFSQITFGIQAGGHLGTFTNKTEGNKDNGYKSLFGFKAGGIAQVGISDKFYFMPELSFVAKGTKYENTEIVELLGFKTTTITKGETKPLYLEMPLNFAYITPSDDGSGFFGGIGPVVSIGLGGKSESTSTSIVEAPGLPAQTSIISGNLTIKFDGKENANDGYAHLKRVELGGNIFAGYRLTNGLFAKATYNMGLTNISPAGDASLKTSYFGITIGYFFGK